MALRALSTSPKSADFTPLQEHQEQTPSTFFGAKPVLYAKQDSLTLSVLESKLRQDPVFSKFHSERDGEGQDALIKGVEVWVNSENLIFFQETPAPTGVVIPYQSIALHATMKWESRVEALYMNISLNDAETVNAEEDIDVLELTVLPPGYATGNTHAACIQEIFGAMNTCADLHPDSGLDDDGDEDLTAPGASGWITADNMDEYMDEEGNFRGTIIGGEELGPGAGSVRQRVDGDDEGTNGVSGADGHGEKYQRTS